MGTQQRVTDTEGSCRKLVENNRRARWVVVLVVPLGQKLKTIQIDGIPAENAGQELVEHDMLHLGTDNFTGMMEELFSIPVRIHSAQTLNDAVVFTQKGGVNGSQTWLLGSTIIASKEAQTVAGLALGMGSQRQKFLAPHLGAVHASRESTKLV